MNKPSREDIYVEYQGARWYVEQVEHIIPASGAPEMNIKARRVNLHPAKPVVLCSQCGQRMAMRGRKGHERYACRQCGREVRP